jgi:hypothetical protein
LQAGVLEHVARVDCVPLWSEAVSELAKIVSREPIKKWPSFSVSSAVSYAERI